ncbi:5-methylcytosine-specific restriction endonuclease system specificity protein McrC [Snodgrassella alvi]|uniref:5-methylcytosine restriction system specificity protein McrC n=1 Tax=Snodgrassella alvi TaxID=1196083 RepID=UPI00351CA5E2
MSNKQETSTTVAKIPIKNIWLLLLYASNLYQTLGKQQRIQLENNPEDLIKLAAKLYCEATEKLMRSLSCGYIQQTQILNRVRGKIDILATVRQHLLEKGRIQCQFEVLTIDTPKNRYIHAAAHTLLPLIEDKKLKIRCQKIISRFNTLKIGQSTQYDFRADYFDRAGTQDRYLLTLCRLIFKMAIPTEQAGVQSAEQINKTDTWLRQLFEKATIGFARVNLPASRWKISSGKQLSWQQESASNHINKFLPDMQTDLIIEHTACQHRMIIDTKCTSIVRQSRSKKDKFKSEHIYQLYAYLRSQENTTDAPSCHATGMLLYPAIDENINEHVIIQNHTIRFSTINLQEDSKLIRKNLLRLLSQCNCIPTNNK